MQEHVIQMLNEGKKNGKIQQLILKGILSLSQTRREEFLTHYYLTVAQCIDKNIELISSIRTFSQYPDLLSMLQPYTGYTMNELQRLSKLREELPPSVPTTPEEIVLVDMELRHLLCPGNQTTKQVHSHSERRHKTMLRVSPERRSETSKLRQLVAEKESVIRALMIQIVKLKVQLPGGRTFGA
ncbi:MAG: hypothetical protein HY282_07475 [Nitrospirae bacterium]|nr:hypothetical protein [Candidatus Manganitrophaceae bacterium]